MESLVQKLIAAAGFAAAAWLAAGGSVIAAAAPTAATAQAPVVATRLVPAQPGLAGPQRIGVLVFFDFTPASEMLLVRLPTWLEGTGRAIVLDREPVVVGTGATPFARAFIMARTLGVTGSVLPALFKLAQATPPNGQTPPDQQAMQKTRAAIAAIFARVGINEIEFSAAWHSPATASGLIRARAMSDRFEVAAAPVLIVNGQWKLLPAPGASATDVLAALNRKIEAAVAKIASNR